MSLISVNQTVCILTVALAISFLFYLCLYYETFHLHLTHTYAHLGYATAQHSIGQRYLQGHGVVKNDETAMKWFRKAADQGHPHSSYNLAVGKLKELTSDVEDWEMEGLLSRAAEHGIKEAQEVLIHLYKKRDQS
ncbi:uncharacterized protein [Scyliorhinus torazame]|uniref:uncharacterized protein isoform X4 n=1 Tax=Scyliorhinus torazame TaxID=75743 RepID=UPI003B59F3A8